jgi:hypothetical protein
MSDRIRCLNDNGIAAFDRYLSELARNARVPPPHHLLEDPDHSHAFDREIEIDRAPHGIPFGSRFEFGTYLHERLSAADQASIARNYRFWNWLSLYYFEQLCPPGEDGARRVAPKELYLFLPRQSYRQHVRHLVRSPWLIVNTHGFNAKVLLLGTERGSVSPLTSRSKIFEQLATRQNILNNKTVIAAAHRLYFDERNGRTWFGASGNGPGSVARYALVVQQLELTYDTRACSVDQLLSLLPNEFADYKGRAAGDAQRQGSRSMRSRALFRTSLPEYADGPAEAEPELPLQEPLPEPAEVSDQGALDGSTEESVEAVPTPFEPSIEAAPAPPSPPAPVLEMPHEAKD